MTTEAAETTETKRVSKTGWLRAADHTVTLPSGAVVGIKLPDLPALIEAGELPQGLLDAALKFVSPNAKPEEPSRESIGRDRAFRDLLVQITVTEPKITDADLPNIPVEDKDMIVDFALRQRDLDAVGEHIGGLTKYENFRRFRGIDGVDSLLEGA